MTKLRSKCMDCKERPRALLTKLCKECIHNRAMEIRYFRMMEKELK